MITKWKLFNFKSIRKETELEFAPLTIFAGANSSGKSTLLQSILLVCQTLSNKVGSKSVVLNGLLTKLGQFDDIRSQESESDQILIGWECKPLSSEATEGPWGRQLGYVTGSGRIRAVNCEFSFDIKTPKISSEIAQFHPSFFSLSLKSIFESAETGETPVSIGIVQGGRASEKAADVVNEDVTPESLSLNVRLNQDSLDELKERFASAEPYGSTLFHFLPDGLVVRYDIAKEEARQIVLTIFERGLRIPTSRLRRNRNPLIPHSVVQILKARMGELGNFVDKIVSTQASLVGEEKGIPLLDFVKEVQELPFSQRKEIRTILDDAKLSGEISKAIIEEKGRKYALVRTMLPENITESVSYLVNLFSHDVKYLGPLRDEPRSIYPLVASADPTDVGLRGEYTAAVLNNYKESRVSYIPSSTMDKMPHAGTIVSRTLETAVIDWLKYLGVAETVSTFDRGKHGHELKITTIGTAIPQDLTHVGVGVSQVLPILVVCLLAEPDQTLIIEQPELHLHPLVQTRLADFFLSMAILGKQCILESHSEYLINRLRYRMASDETNSLNRFLGIYFVEKEGADSSFRRINVNDFGAITEWPVGFFDQSQSEAEEILMAASRKRKAQKGNKSNA